jgi:hypothetical protein
VAHGVGFEEHRSVDATISLIGGDASELNSLYAWLQREDEFRGQVKAVSAALKSGEMGGVTEMLTVALGSGGAGAVLAGTLSTWLSMRRTKINVDFSSGDRTRRVEIDVANAADAQRLLQAALDDVAG